MPDIRQLSTLLQQTPDLCGFNVTIPHKQNILPFLDEISEEARAIGAVNCVKVSHPNGQPYLVGYNTDMYGFRKALLEFIPAAISKALAYYNASATDKYLVDQGGKWSAQAANDYMATILPEYSEANGNMVELIICNNDGMAEGAVSALQGAGYNTGDGKTIPVFGVDATDSAKQLINEGKMTGTIKQDAEGMASTILNLVSSVQGGGELMDNTSSFNVDEGVAKIRVPYATYTGE